ncbi:unnamed protein product [Schistocephalus solidus]|uniref:2-methoxy-6-polyprenyl-1,4-benzoquinol methylase, mitochondrial n=1 Tax=Schistocephalus solidus TaxID=70667 RepID=A0A183SUM3_SCHSO|nr:unnamed protein product [Schistocephalus solidus]
MASLIRYSVKSLLSSRLASKKLINFPRCCASTHFGFETVDEKEKQAKADKYDLMNDAMSAGIHRIWKNLFVHSIMPTSNLNCLDVAGGTGDIAIRMARFSKNVTGQHQSLTEIGRKTLPKITVCDINDAMMEVGRAKANALGLTEIEWVQGNAENLPFDDNMFDLYTIAYGIRNCTHIDKVLEEACRVLKPGGRFCCLEFSRVQNPLLRKQVAFLFYDAYSMRLIPVMGQLIAGDWHSYQYLVESIRRFPDQEEFASMIEAAGFRSVNWTNYTFGVTAVHVGIK